MVKPKFAFFQMEIKTVFLQATEFDQARFGICPKTFYPIYVGALICTFIAAMFHAKMFLIAQIHKAIIPAPAIRMDDAFKLNPTPDNALERTFGAIRDYFSVNTAIALEESKYNSFATSASAS